MKTIKLLSALVILIFSVSQSNAAGLNSVFSKDGINVWAVGPNGYIINSTNGGLNWSIASIGTTTYNSVFSVNQNIWIAGNAGTLQITTDNGYSWNQQTLAGGINLKSIFFINSSTGWIAGDNGTILKSTNGGINWTAQTSPVSYNLDCITFTDNLNGVACGVNGTVIITTNGGSNWLASVTNTTKELFSVDMKAGTIIASGLDVTVIRSTNNGASWNFIDYKIQTKVDVNSIYMLDPNTYYSAGSDGFIRKSSDGGNTFIYQSDPMLADIYKIYFFNSSTGWAAGRDNNVVLSTTDGGNSWKMPSGTNQAYAWATRFGIENSWGNIFSLSVQNPKEFFFFANKHVYRSLNYGVTYTATSNTPVPFGNTPHSLVISPKDSNKMLVAYDSLFSVPPFEDDRIFRTTNYGNSWTVTFVHGLSNDSNPLAIDPDHPDTVYLATKDSLVFRSTDFGLNWVPTGPSHLGKICYLLVVKGHSNILIAGAVFDTNVARISRSTDFGATWNTVLSSNKIEAGEYPEIPAIISNIADPDKIFAAMYEGDMNGLQISTNAGLTWTRNYVDTNAWGFGTAIDDPNLLLLGNDESNKAFISMNGGTNWNQLPNVVFDDNQSILCYNRKVILAQQHFAIVQLIPSYNYPIGIQPISTEVPEQFSLHQNYPNPFNPETKIKFEIPSVGVTRRVALTIFNALGQQVTTLINEQLKAGVYEVSWNAADYPSGVYFYSLVIGDNTNNGNFKQTKKLVLLK